MRNPKWAGVAWNGAAALVPLLAAVACVPVLVQTLGATGFGMVGLVWGVVGYASILDLGVSQALTLQVCFDLKSRRDSNARIVSALALLMLLSTAVAAIIFQLADPIAAFFSARETAPVDGFAAALRAMALCLPFSVLFPALAGVFDAHENFKEISLLKSAQSLATYGAAIAAALLLGTVESVIHSTLVVRVIATLTAFVRCQRRGYLSLRRAGPELNALRELLSTGGWLFINNLTSQAIFQSDRWMVARIAGLEAVGIYTVVSELVTKLGIVSGAVVGTYYPAMGKQTSPPALRRTVAHCLRVVIASMGLACVAVALTLPLVLPVWLPAPMAQPAVIPGLLLLVGLLANAPARVWVAGLQALGQVRPICLLNLAQLPLQLLAVYGLTSWHGLTGAATAGLARNAVDALMLFLLWRLNLRRATNLGAGG